LIAHLLRLKQQIVAFDIEFITPEVTKEEAYGTQLAGSSLPLEG
jgi:hypothetical protein